MFKQPELLLIVDDSVLVIERLKMALQELLMNIEVMSVLKGADAFTAIHSIKPLAVLLDIKLPDISGHEVLKQIKVAYPEIKVIMLTNQSSAKIRKMCLEIGAEAFYDKTKEFEKAIEHIKKLYQ